MTKKKSSPQKEVDLTLIDEPDGMVRLEIDHQYIAELAQSIKEIGLLQPILLAKDGARYEIVAGHCRFLAHQKAGILRIKANIQEMTRDEIGIARATENLNRKNLTPIEEAATYKDLVETHSMSISDVAKKMGKSPGLIKRRMDLLKMPPQLQKAVHQKQVSISVAEELWPITDEVQLDYYLSFALDGGCTQAVARSWCKDWRDSKRRQESGTYESGEAPGPYEPRPTFLPCDVCQGPVELGKDKVMRACPECYQLIMQSLKGVK